VETEEDWEAASKVLFERTHAKLVVLKLGKRGAYIYDGEAGTFVPAFVVDAIDATAAGDSFTAALSLHYLETGDIMAAARRGNAAGAIATLTVGAQPSLPNNEMIDDFLAKH